MRINWLPWKFILSRVARAHGFLDPIALMARMQNFAQPSEVSEPIELLRAGVILHARGLINSRVIQHNLDWVWPFWVERQFDPRDVAFVPRAFSITHINLTHRNWTAVGLPDFDELPIIDPHGLVTPIYDAWSIDAWVINDEGDSLLPSRLKTVDQQLKVKSAPMVITQAAHEGMALRAETATIIKKAKPVCITRYRAVSDKAGWLVVALRPYNPEGISFIHNIKLLDAQTCWQVNGKDEVRFSEAVERHHVSDYAHGDVYIHLHDSAQQVKGECDIGMATAAALYRLQPGEAKDLVVEVPLEHGQVPKGDTLNASDDWATTLSKACQLSIPDKHFQFLYDAAIQTLVLHSPEDVYPGPYTYKRFWFRDAAFILNALLCAGFYDRVKRTLNLFPERQTRLGYFRSQDGEWDSNGEALWIMHRYCQMRDCEPDLAWQQAISRGAKWIVRKRLPDYPVSPHAGLLPAGFSAEHLGPNDYYYWDDFWGISGLLSASKLMQLRGEEKQAQNLAREAEVFQAAVDNSLQKVSQTLRRPAMPASPYRRLDPGMIGSIVAAYPLQLFAADDPRLLDSADFLLENTFVNGGFFQDMIHSGVNAYLTLHVAQVLLRAGDARYFDLITAVAKMASPTGQWPEAIHPKTGGGCMGDGQHVWAAAEWVLMLRNCFVREEGNTLILASGIPSDWLNTAQPISFGVAPTLWGEISILISISGEADNKIIRVEWQGHWHKQAPDIEVRLPGFKPVKVAENIQFVEFSGGVQKDRAAPKVVKV